MLNRDNCDYIANQAARLLNGPKGTVSRSLRRLLEQAFGENINQARVIVQSLAYDEGYIDEQLKAMAAYAQYLAQTQAPDMPATVVKEIGVVQDKMFGIVSVCYEILVDLKTASVAQLRDLVQFSALLGANLHDFRRDCNVAMGDFPEYKYRNFPCCIVSDEQLWCVSGHDRRGGSGVLEWCVDENDANYIMTQMNRIPGRFEGLVVEKWSSVIAEDIARENALLQAA